MVDINGNSNSFVDVSWRSAWTERTFTYAKHKRVFKKKRIATRNNGSDRLIYQCTKVKAVVEDGKIISISRVINEKKR